MTLRSAAPCALRSRGPRRALCLTPRARWLPGSVLVLLVLLCGVPSALASRSLLVLGVLEEGRARDGLRTEVTELLKRAGANLIEPPRLSSSERSCDESRCLNQVAAEHHADLILAARIERQGGRDRMLHVWLYEARSGRDLSERERCDVRELEERLRTLAGRLVGPLLQEGIPEPPPAAAPTETPAPTSDLLQPKTAATAPPRSTPRPPDRRSRLTPLRLGLTIGLGTLAVASLGTAIGLSALQHRAIPDATCTDPVTGSSVCAYSLTAAIVPTYVAAGLLGGAAALTFFLPSSSEVRR